MQALAALLESLERILFVPGALDNLGEAAGADVAQDGLHLVGGGRVLGDVELKRLASGLCLGRVVAGLVERGADLGVGRDLLDEVGDADGRGRARLVEDGDDVEGFALRRALVLGLARCFFFRFSSPIPTLRAARSGKPALGTCRVYLRIGTCWASW